MQSGSLLWLAPLAAATWASGADVKVIAFGSCSHQDREQPAWDAIVAERPDLFLFLGDNVYADRPGHPATPGNIAAAYRELAAQPGYRRLREARPLLATWDDHDFGQNDAGVEYPFKRQSQALMLAAFGEPADSPRWTRDGVYGAWTFGEQGRRVQVLLLDTRYFRDRLARDPSRAKPGRGSYVPQEDPSATMLGAAQWEWLESQLRQPADLRILGSSIQVIAREHGYETWGNLPRERRRLYQLIRDTGAEGVVFISGDRHLTEISREQSAETPYPIYDFTSSGLDQSESPVDEPNRFRISPVLRTANFGVIRVDWDAAPVRVEMASLDGLGQTLFQHAVTLAELAPR